MQTEVGIRSTNTTFSQENQGGKGQSAAEIALVQTHRAQKLSGALHSHAAEPEGTGKPACTDAGKADFRSALS
jgi:hypothetical protein